MPKLAPVPSPEKPQRKRRSPAERRLLEEILRMFAELRNGATWRERQELRSDMRRAIERFFAERLAEGPVK